MSIQSEEVLRRNVWEGFGAPLEESLTSPTLEFSGREYLCEKSVDPRHFTPKNSKVHRRFLHLSFRTFVVVHLWTLAR